MLGDRRADNACLDFCSSYAAVRSLVDIEPDETVVPPSIASVALVYQSGALMNYVPEAFFPLLKLVFGLKVILYSYSHYI